MNQTDEFSFFVMVPYNLPGQLEARDPVAMDGTRGTRMRRGFGSHVTRAYIPKSLGPCVRFTCEVPVVLYMLPDTAWIWSPLFPLAAVEISGVGRPSEPDARKA